MMDFSRIMLWLIEIFILQTSLTLGCIPNIIYRVGNHNHDKVSFAFRQTWSITATHNLYCNKAKIPCMQDWVEAVGQDGFIIRQQITPESRLKKTKYRNIISKNKHSNASNVLFTFFGLTCRLISKDVNTYTQTLARVWCLGLTLYPFAIFFTPETEIPKPFSAGRKHDFKSKPAGSSYMLLIKAINYKCY